MLPRQRPSATRQIISVAPITKDDLARLKEPRRATVVQRLKDSHHFLARLFAAGLNIPEVATRAGMTPERVRRLRKSPAFEQLVAEYRDIVNQTWAESVDDYQELLLGNMIRAELQLSDKLAEAEDGEREIPIRELQAISRDAADRMGYGKKSTNVNVNVDFASQLEKAIRRSATARVITAEIAGTDRGTAKVPALAAPPVAQERSQAPTPVSHNAVESAPVPFRRRA